MSGWIDLYTRTDAGWIDEIVTGDAVLNLSSIGVEIALDAIYEDTELDATRPREDGAPARAGVKSRSCCSDGNPPRTSAMRAGSILAVMMPTPSPPSASTSPHGSTISEWP